MKKKSFKLYLIIWLLCVALFNVWIFCIPSGYNGKTIINVVNTIIKIKGGLLVNPVLIPDFIYQKYSNVFWIAYIFTHFSFIFQLISSYLFYKNIRNNSILALPLTYYSYIIVVLSCILNTYFIFNINIPIWFSIAINLTITVFLAIMICKYLLSNEIIKNINSNKNNAVTKDFIYRIENMNKSHNADYKELLDVLKYEDISFINSDESIKNELYKNISNPNRCIKLIKDYKVKYGRN